MIMGRKTFDSLPGLLAGRRHLVLTRDPAWSAEGAEVVRTIEEAVARAGGERVSVIGGAEVFALFLDSAERIELTEVHAAPAGDTKMPRFDPARWRETHREDRPAEGDRLAFSFVTLARRFA